MIGHIQRADFVGAGNPNGADYGSEIDASVAKPINKNFTLLVKAASFNSKDYKAASDTNKVWLQATYSF